MDYVFTRSSRPSWACSVALHHCVTLAGACRFVTIPTILQEQKAQMRLHVGKKAKQRPNPGTQKDRSERRDQETNPSQKEGLQHSGTKRKKRDSETHIPSPSPQGGIIERKRWDRANREERKEFRQRKKKEDN
ncbi:hypothetical protein HNY73_019582 [Argiope bruennichi]|uniref:Uncharacterized protein n=1 Tax=Argiope bruennichi TaxID=94029 RepID=A0A8T0E3R2_ARGBR|nr:hypothetical protein HNY73_019582 [Argiope bruennichi]